MKKPKGLDSNGNCVYSLMYHLIVCVKFRRRAFEKDYIAEECKNIIRRLSEASGVEVLEIECGSDHIHILFKTKPTTELTKYINLIKGRSSRELREKFPELRKILWGDAFWSPSYYIASAGNVSLDTLIKYVEDQRTKEGLE